MDITTMSSNVIECIHKIADGPEITPSNTNCFKIM